MNQIQIHHEYFSSPDLISIRLNNRLLYQGPANVGSVDFVPHAGNNVLTVNLDVKSVGNFLYDSASNQVLKDSKVIIKEIIVEKRYFRSLVIKCGLVEVDLAQNINFPSKYLDHENVLTMAGSQYLIKFDYPIKNWMQIHRHQRDLTKIKANNILVTKRLNENTAQSKQE